jgi:nucleotide sugar dehydrogenase
MKNKIENIFISPDTRIKDAMKTISRAAHLKLPVGIVLITDSRDKLKGVVTDGDIRRALVRGINLDDHVSRIMTRDPITVHKDMSVDEMVATVIRKVKESGRIRDYKIDKVIAVDRGNRVRDVLDFSELWHRKGAINKKICIVGTGHIGLTLCAIMAEAGYQVKGYDIRKDLVAKQNRGETHFYEKGLQPLLKLHLRNKRIKFISALKSRDSDVYIICVGTPINDKTHEPVLENIRAAAKSIGRVLKKGDLVILRSTVFVGTTRNVIRPILEKASLLKAGADFGLVFAPERAVEGRVLEETDQIPQILGGFTRKCTENAIQVLEVMNPSVVVLESLEAAEMVKLVNNTFRDFSFAFANKIALMCAKLGFNAVKVIKAANEGYPRNPVSLPSPGVGGYCLHKDTYLMAKVAQDLGINPDIFFHARDINNRMPLFVAAKAMDFLQRNYKSARKIKIFILGFAFKGDPETSDMRNSPTLDVLEVLRSKLKKKAVFFGYDPIVGKKGIEGQRVKFTSFRHGFKGAHCVLIMNNNPEFAKIDVFSLLETMKKPGFFFDGWHFFHKQEVVEAKGIVYQGLGGGFN